MIDFKKPLSRQESNNSEELARLHLACRERGFFQSHFGDLLNGIKKNLAMAILTQMENALKIDVKELNKSFEDGMQSMRMNYYPPCPHPEKVIDLTPHSDPIGLTILLQVNEIEGLQIMKEGIWVPVKPLPDAFIVNV